MAGLPSPTLPPCVVAIVDDDEAVRLSLVSLLRSLGCVARPYAGAADFLDALHGAGPPAAAPDCLIADLHMAPLNGDELQRALIARGCRVPTIFITSGAAPALRLRLLARGATCLLDKPVDGATLEACLRLALRPTAPPAAGATRV